MPELNQRLQQKLGLKINPAQMQLAKMCELPNVQLEQLIKEEMEANPALEIASESGDGEFEEAFGDSLDENLGADASSSDERHDEGGDEWESDRESGNYDDDTDYPISQGRDQSQEKRSFVYRDEQSFRESLLSQLAVSRLNDSEKRIAEYVIGNLDEDGYLRRDMMQLSDDLAFIGITADSETIKRVVATVQEFDPPGIAASDLRECLLIQIRRKLATTGDSPSLRLAERVLDEAFDDFSRKNYPKVIKRLQCSEEELRDAVDEILKLNPKPGGSSAEGDGAVAVIPDFTLELSGGELHLTLNSDEIPELHLSKAYLDMLKRYQESGDTRQNREALAFVRSKLGSADSFIKAIKQRNATLMAVMQAIVAVQREYFLSGGDESALKPMILKDIADITGLDISTVSRVANSKYVETWFGLFALGDFFTGGIQNAAGEEVSVEEVKRELRRLIDEEDKSAPLNDDDIVKALEERGYNLARRTVAKYRTAMGIPVARLRRRI